MKILNNKRPKIDLLGTPSIYHLFLFFVFYLTDNYVLILKNVCQNIHLSEQLKAHKAGNRKFLID